MPEVQREPSDDPILTTSSVSERLDALTELAEAAHDLWGFLYRSDRFSRVSVWMLASWPFDPTARMFAREGSPFHETFMHELEGKKNLREGDPLLPVVAQPYWVESFALAACRKLRLSAEDVSALIELQALRTNARSRRDRLRPQAMLAAVLLGASLVVSQVPEELFERLDWDYGTFQIIVFIFVALSTVMLVLAWASTRADFARETRIGQIVEAALTYMKIAYERREDPWSDAIRANADPPARRGPPGGPT